MVEFYFAPLARVALVVHVSHHLRIGVRGQLGKAEDTASQPQSSRVLLLGCSAFLIFSVRAG